MSHDAALQALLIFLQDLTHFPSYLLAPSLRPTKVENLFTLSQAPEEGSLLGGVGFSSSSGMQLCSLTALCCTRWCPWSPWTMRGQQTLLGIDWSVYHWTLFFSSVVSLKITCKPHQGFWFQEKTRGNLGVQVKLLLWNGSSLFVAP